MECLQRFLPKSKQKFRRTRSPHPKKGKKTAKPSTKSPAAAVAQKAGPDWKKVVLAARKRFGIKGFRPGQKEILEAVFAGRDVLGLMPTGGGKSLTYQLPALFLEHPVVVVSPLIAPHAGSAGARVAGQHPCGKS